jgi:hypothetical protein
VELESSTLSLSTTIIMKTLPPELLEGIVAEIPSPSILLQLRTCSSLFNILATPLAFRSIRFKNTDRSLERFKRVAMYDKFAQHIRQVIYQYEEADLSTYERYFQSESSDLSCDCEGESVRSHGLRGFDGTLFVEALAILSQLPSLKSLVIKLREYDGPFGASSDDTPAFPPEVVLQFLIFKALGEISPGFASPLKSLTIDSLLLLPHPSLRESTIIRLLATLTHLAINTTTDCAAFGMSSSQPGTSVTPIFPRAAFSSSLVSLQLHHVCVRSPNALAPITEVHLPHLAYLSLQRHLFSERCEVENFITRHGKTLVELKLFLCPMAMETKAVTEISKGRSARFRRWAQVWDCFRVQLKVLRNLVVSEGSDSNGVKDGGLGRYIANSDRRTAVNLGKADRSDDDNALKSLRDNVERREEELS